MRIFTLTAVEQGINGKCLACSGMEESKQCVQNFQVDIRDFNEADLGCGVSLAAVTDRMDPLPVRFLCILYFPGLRWARFMENLGMLKC